MTRTGLLDFTRKIMGCFFLFWHFYNYSMCLIALVWFQLKETIIYKRLNTYFNHLSFFSFLVMFYLFKKLF